MDKPVFTVITVTYNAGETLIPTIESVCNQTYPHVEYILIDGASTDQTLEIAHAYQARIATLISEPDQGLYDAMNKALRYATGDYICFLNAGDRFHSLTLLSDIAAPLKTQSCAPDVLYGQTVLIDSTGRYLRMRHYSAPEKLSWKSFQKGMLVCHQAFWVKRSLWEPYDLQYRFSADFDWCIRMLKKSTLCFYTHRILIDYLDEGLTTQNHKASLLERFRIMTVHYGWLLTLWAHLRFAARALGNYLLPKTKNQSCTDLFHESDADKNHP